MDVHKVLLYSLIILSVVSYVCTIVFNALSAVAENGVFATTASNISSKYSLEITPAGWTFSIWSVIYIWNGLWIVYVFSTLFRRNKSGFVYLKPGIHTPEFFAVWILNNIINISWLFLWDQEILILGNVFLILIPITCILMLTISYRNCYKHGIWMSENSRFDLWCIRILVHNGLATYTTWTCIATVINFGIVLKYYVNIEDAVASNMVLCLVFFALLSWFFMETFVFEKYVRYTFTIYPVAIIASVGVFVERDHSAALSTNDIINIVIIGMSSFACLLRFTLLFSCDKLRPLFSEKHFKTSNGDLHVSNTQQTRSDGHTNPMTIEMMETQ
ncbi:uncharacterized protein WCC33_009831 [Rhinophrynus dorsalis]